MLKKKLCLIGAYAVGKTSLIRQFVSGKFSDEYLTTVGVKIDQRSVTVEGQDILLMIWDLSGRDEFEAVQKAYLRGASGFLYVADGTRRETLYEVQKEITAVSTNHAGVPGLLLVNKCDVPEAWEVEDGDLEPFQTDGITPIVTSALTGQNVGEAFDELARLMMADE